MTSDRRLADIPAYLEEPAAQVDRGVEASVPGRGGAGMPEQVDVATRRVRAQRLRSLGWGTWAEGMRRQLGLLGGDRDPELQAGGVVGDVEADRAKVIEREARLA